MIAILEKGVNLNISQEFRPKKNRRKRRRDIAFVSFCHVCRANKSKSQKIRASIKNVSNNCFKKYFNTLQSLLQRINIECATGWNLSMKGQGLCGTDGISKKKK